MASSLADSPRCLDEYESWKARGEPEPSCSGGSFSTKPPHIFSWTKGRGCSFFPVSVEELEQTALETDCDIQITLLPNIGHEDSPSIRSLRDRFGLPDDFMHGEIHCVSHSFGLRDDMTARRTVLWSQLWVVIPLPHGRPREEDRRYHRRSSILVTWESPDDKSDGKKLRVLCSQAPVTLVDRLETACRDDSSLSWEEALEDPFLLLNLFYQSWFFTLSGSCWDVILWADAVEMKIFDEATRLPNSRAVQNASAIIDLHKAHQVAKSIIFTSESVNQAIKALNLIIARHADMLGESPISKLTHQSLERNRELFLSSQLRMACIDRRLRNAINLAFNLQNIRDSRTALKASNVLQRDSHTMRALSVLAMFFLPLSTVSTIFGTQFFTSVANEDAGGRRDLLVVNRKFWMLWAIALPLTATVLLGWIVWERMVARGCAGQSEAEADIIRLDGGDMNARANRRAMREGPWLEREGGTGSPRLRC